MEVLDLFSGIGAFSLGLERAGMETIAFCEIDEYCQQVLRRHWPDVEIVSDVHGFPLSGFVSRRQAGGPGGHSLEPGLRPDWLVIENVFHTWRRWVPELRRELWARGYASLPIRVSAAEVGATHERKRCFLVAHADGARVREFKRWWHGPAREVADELSLAWYHEPAVPRVDDGTAHRLDRNKAIGNSVVPQIVEIIGRGITACN